MTTNINLLPWREERRERNKKYFFLGLGFSGVAAILCIILTFLILVSCVDDQKKRNQLIENEIARYDREIVKIKELKSMRDSFIARMLVIQKLQESRSEIVHFFDELVNVIPKSIYLLSVDRFDNNILLTGHTDTHSSVSLLMHNIRNNSWLSKPELQEVIEVTNKKYSKLYNQFRIKLKIKPINRSHEDGFDE